MSFTHPSRTGNAFILTADLGVYIGPGKDGKGPILAIFENGSTDYTTIASFRNATGATRLARLLQDHIDMVMEQTAEQRPDSRVAVRGDDGKVVGYADIHLTDEDAIAKFVASHTGGISIGGEDAEA